MSRTTKGVTSTKTNTKMVMAITILGAAAVFVTLPSFTLSAFSVAEKPDLVIAKIDVNDGLPILPDEKSAKITINYTNRGLGTTDKPFTILFTTNPKLQLAAGSIFQAVSVFDQMTGELSSVTAEEKPGVFSIYVNKATSEKNIVANLNEYELGTKDRGVIQLFLLDPKKLGIPALGDFTIEVMIDSKKDIIESNEQNNRRLVTVSSTAFLNTSPTTTLPTVSIYCEETDNGFDIYTKGKLTAFSNEGSASIVPKDVFTGTDYCLNNSSLIEYHCDEVKKWNATPVNCESSCSDGACAT